LEIRWVSAASDDSFDTRAGRGKFVDPHDDVLHGTDVPGARSSVSLILIDTTGEKMIATRRDQDLQKAIPNDAKAAVAAVDAVLLDNRYANITLPI
jgi:hypothetical protein